MGFWHASVCCYNSPERNLSLTQREKERTREGEKERNLWQLWNKAPDVPIKTVSQTSSILSPCTSVSSANSTETHLHLQLIFTVASPELVRKPVSLFSWQLSTPTIGLQTMQTTPPATHAHCWTYRKRARALSYIHRLLWPYLLTGRDLSPSYFWKGVFVLWRSKRRMRDILFILSETQLLHNLQNFKSRIYIRLEMPQLWLLFEGEPRWKDCRSRTIIPIGKSGN